MKNAEEYRASVAGVAGAVYVRGQHVPEPAEHPMLAPSLNALSMTYELAGEAGAGELMCRRGLDGREINCFTSIHKSTDDLIRKVKALRMLGQRTGTCFQRCVGWDALNALSSVTYETDAAKGTGYHKRFLDYLAFVQENDLVLNGAMTDVKGDRSKRPSEQSDPDMFLRVVERRPDGIVVRGAKAHQTGAVFAHEIVVMPTLSLKPEDRGLCRRVRHSGQHPGDHAHPRPAIVRHPQARGRHDRRGQRPLRRPRSAADLQRRVRAVGAGLPVRRDGVRRPAGGALCRLSPPELRRLQGRGRATCSSAPSPPRPITAATPRPGT